MAVLSAVAGRGRPYSAAVGGGVAAVGKGAGLTTRGIAFMDSHDSRRSCLASLLSL